MLIPALCLIIGFCLGMLFTTLRLIRRYERDLRRLEARMLRLDKGQHSVDHVAYRNTREIIRMRSSVSDVLRSIIDMDQRLRSTEVIHTEILRSLPPPTFDEEEPHTEPFPWGPHKR